MVERVGIFGGTFDPIHNGHLRLAIELKETLGLDLLHLIPCFMPTYRDAPRASGDERLAMLNLAIAGLAGMNVDAREIRREHFTYSIDSVREFREAVGAHVRLCFCMGADSFHNLGTWRDWRSLTNYAHLIVAARPGSPISEDGMNLPDEVREFYLAHRGDIEGTYTAPAGSVVVLSSRLMDISATDIRNRLQQQLSVRGLVPDLVESYLLRETLYR